MNLIDITYDMNSLQSFENHIFFRENRSTILADFEFCYRDFLNQPVDQSKKDDTAYINSLREVKTNYLSCYISGVLYSLEPSSGVFKKVVEFAQPKLIL